MTAHRKHEIRVRQAVAEKDVLLARRFQARRYLEVGYVETLTADGMIDDQWVEHSQYFIAEDVLRDNRVVGTCRFIHADPLSLPALTSFEIDPTWMEAFASEPFSQLYELGALAADSSYGFMSVGALLYRETVRQFRADQRKAHFVAALDHRLFVTTRRFMNLPLQHIGKPAEYLGSLTVPAYLHVPTALKHLTEKRPNAALLFTEAKSVSEVLDLCENALASPPAIDLREVDADRFD